MIFSFHLTKVLFWTGSQHVLCVCVMYAYGHYFLLYIEINCKTVCQNPYCICYLFLLEKET